MNEHRIVLVIAANYRTGDVKRTIETLLHQHYEITSKRAQAKPSRHAWAYIDDSADELESILERQYAPE